MSRTLIASLAVAVSLSAAAIAQEGDPTVWCGSVNCFKFRVPAMGQSPESRCSRAMEAINKNLGGKFGKVVTRPAGKNVKLLLNNDVVAVITPQDAKADRFKTPAQLASKWQHILARAFDASKAQK